MATREIWRSGLSVAWSKATCHRFNSDTNPSAQNGGARPQPFPDQVSGSESDRDPAVTVNTVTGTCGTVIPVSELHSRLEPPPFWDKPATAARLPTTT